MLILFRSFSERCSREWILSTRSVSPYLSAFFGVSQMAIEDVSKGGNDRPVEDITIADSGEVCVTSLGCLAADISVPSSPSTWTQMAIRYPSMLSSSQLLICVKSILRIKHPSLRTMKTLLTIHPPLMRSPPRKFLLRQAPRLLRGRYWKNPRFSLGVTPSLV